MARTRTSRTLILTGLAAAALLVAIPLACVPVEVTCRDTRTCWSGGAGAAGPESSGQAGQSAGGFAGSAGFGGAVVGNGGEPGASGSSSGGADAGAGGGGGDAGFGGISGAGGEPPCDGACGGETSICDAVDDHCVECLADNDCPTTRPACDPASRECVECRVEAHCAGSKPHCDAAANACVACLEDEHCTSPGASRCVVGECVPCAKRADCAHLPGQTVCDATSGQCVECTGKDFSTCGQDAGVPLVCDSLTRTCESYRQRSAGLCQPCVADAHCRAGQLCVLERYGNPPKDVGYFCQWKRGDVANGAPADCATARPYVAADTNVVSIDGETADVCSLRTSTCAARNDFSTKNCAPIGTPDDELCGFAPPNDALCVPFGTSQHRCTVTCGSDDDCPSNFACDTGASPPVCQL